MFMVPTDEIVSVSVRVVKVKSPEAVSCPEAFLLSTRK